MIESISAVTLGTHQMPRAVGFYRALGFEVLHGGEASSFTSFRAGASYLNLIAQPAERRWFWWGRVIFYVSDVDALHQRALAAGYQPTTSPRDAEWGERFFHLDDPDGHELRPRAVSPTLISMRSSSNTESEKSSWSALLPTRASNPRGALEWNSAIT